MEIELTVRERQLMDALFKDPDITAQEIAERMPEELSNSTIRTLLRILERKGHVKHLKVGRRFVYAPRADKKQAARSALRRMLSVFYEGSAAQAVSGLLDLKETAITDRELDEMEKMIEKSAITQGNVMTWLSAYTWPILWLLCKGAIILLIGFFAKLEPWKGGCRPKTHGLVRRVPDTPSVADPFLGVSSAQTPTTNTAEHRLPFLSWSKRPPWTRGVEPLSCHLPNERESTLHALPPS